MAPDADAELAAEADADVDTGATADPDADDEPWSGAPAAAAAGDDDSPLALIRTRFAGEPAFDAHGVPWAAAFEPPAETCNRNANSSVATSAVASLFMCVITMAVSMVLQCTSSGIVVPSDRAASTANS